jgi:molecular chaperone GrpE
MLRETRPAPRAGDPSARRHWALHVESAAFVLRRLAPPDARRAAPSSNGADRAALAAARADATRLAAERDLLADACIELADVVPSEALRDRLHRSLAQAGIQRIDDVGDRFDPHRHEATDRLPAPSSALEGTIAHTERLGYQDHGQLRRPPRVVVYLREGA